MIRYACPGCAAELSAEDARAGGEDACPKCGTRFLIPGTPPPPPAAEEPRRWRDRDDRLSRRDDRSSRWDDRDDRDDRDDDYRPRRRRRKPERAGAIGGMLLGGGIYSLVWTGAWVVFSTGCFCLLPGTYFGIVWGILAIIRGAAITNDTDRGEAPRALLICQIITIINFDVVNMILGILGLVFLNEPDVDRYFARNSPDYYEDDDR